MSTLPSAQVPLEDLSQVQLHVVASRNKYALGTPPSSVLTHWIVTLSFFALVLTGGLKSLSRIRAFIGARQATC